MSRSCVDTIFCMFSRLLMLNKGNQCMCVDDDKKIRFVYQPMNEVYAVILTNINSNIIEDMETLQLVTGIISDVCGIPTVTNVTNNSFELIFAFDEVISMGYSEKLKPFQIKQFLAMDSHEEKVADILRQNQEYEADKERKAKSKEIEHLRKLERHSHYMQSSEFNSFTSHGSNLKNTVANIARNPIRSDEYLFSRLQAEMEPDYEESIKDGSMSLRTTRFKENEMLNRIDHELRIEGDDRKGSVPFEAGSAQYRQYASKMRRNEGMGIEINERMLIRTDREGNVIKMEIRGELVLFVDKTEYDKISIVMDGVGRSGLEVKLHPLFEKNKFFKDSIIEPKDPSRKFNVNGVNQVLKWRLVSKDGDKLLLPLVINCWPSIDSTGVYIVNMEYEANPDFPLENTLVKIPIKPLVSHLKVTHVDGSIQLGENHFEWYIGSINESDQNLNGTLEFTFEKHDDNPPIGSSMSSLYPISVKFTLDKSICNVTVKDFLINDSPHSFFCHPHLSIESYTIE